MDPGTPTSATNQSSNKRKSPPEGSTSGRPRPKPDFSHGGDLILKSIDGQTFNVHSVILSVASPVFADMFEIGSRNPGETVELAETGEMLDLMLRFIYPKESPTISSFEMLNKAMHVARKYELEGMHRQLRRELAMAGSPVSYASDPLGAYAFATDHELKDETKLSLDLARQTYQFNTIDDLLKLSKTAPASIPWILLVGIPSVKNKILSDVLLKFHEEPMKLVHAQFLCACCNDHQYGIRYSPPEWQARWAHRLLTELPQRPTDTWAPLFETAFLSGIHGIASISTAKGVCTCADRATCHSRATFMKWSSGVHQCLVKRLEGLAKFEESIS
ncbi:hypothetical protein FRC11_011448 [Ceratobasidium sp. 423]|nr:hypothetical protein FRC11_011448 [Ceratobasidium sp. 423]